LGNHATLLPFPDYELGLHILHGAHTAYMNITNFKLDALLALSIKSSSQNAGITLVSIVSVKRFLFLSTSTLANLITTSFKIEVETTVTQLKTGISIDDLF
jgi:hypothetical protein